MRSFFEFLQFKGRDEDSCNNRSLYFHPGPKTFRVSFLEGAKSTIPPYRIVIVPI